MQNLPRGFFVCVVVKAFPTDPFVITSYLTDTMKKGRVLWPIAG